MRKAPVVPDDTLICEFGDGYPLASTFTKHSRGLFRR